MQVPLDGHPPPTADAGQLRQHEVSPLLFKTADVTEKQKIVLLRLAFGDKPSPVRISKNKGDAIEMLDEWGNAEQAILSPLTDCMFDFRLRDDGQIELVDIGESTRDRIFEICYPNLNKAFATAEWDNDGLGYSETGHQQIREAVELERTRLAGSQRQPKEAETGVGREIQKQTGAASVVVNRIVQEAAKRRLKSREGEGRKPN